MPAELTKKPCIDICNIILKIHVLTDAMQSVKLGQK